MSGRYQRHASVDDLRQNLNPLQITLAYRNQSHPQSPRSSKPGESDILTLQKQDTSTLRLQYVAAMLKCPLRRKVEMSLWVRHQPFRNATRDIPTGTEPSPRPDRLDRVAREGRGRVKGTPSALAFSVSFIAFLVDVAGSCMCRARISRCFRKSG
ncbi:hypothetical protein CN212_29770 [Sinorhizobium meliloti]|nr:hypothetical protein CN212_29770 [Sinorhizobium meliloti]